MRWLILSICCMTIVTGCHFTDKPKTVNKIDLFTQTGDKAGTAKLSEQPDGVEIKLKLKGLTPGFHGIHIHEKAECEPPLFQTAGNHYNPDDKEHGLLFPKGAHIGDLKNIEADKNGEVDTTVMANKTTLLTGKKYSLTEKEGTALIITSDPDDGMTQVSGDSGERIICGEIKENGSDT